LFANIPFGGTGFLGNLVANVKTDDDRCVCDAFVLFIFDAFVLFTFATEANDAFRSFVVQEKTFDEKKIIAISP
jgi:hypothetical protein